MSSAMYWMKFWFGSPPAHHAGSGLQHMARMMDSLIMDTFAPVTLTTITTRRRSPAIGGTSSGRGDHTRHATHPPRPGKQTTAGSLSPSTFQPKTNPHPFRYLMSKKYFNPIRGKKSINNAKISRYEPLSDGSTKSLQIFHFLFKKIK